MDNKDRMIGVHNRDNATIFYDIPEMNGLHRVFQPNERKEISMEELIKLSYEPGGMALLRDSLVIEDKGAVARILGHVELEYDYTPADIRKLLVEGSLDELLDCLDFAPDGVIEILKSMAVDLPLNDVAKREAILEKTGFNVTSAINIKKEVEADTEKPATAPTRRRVVKNVAQGAEQTQPQNTGRRVVKKSE